MRTRNSSNVWFFLTIMMNQSSSSILYSGPPWIKKNVNHSINGKKLRYHHRPMTDIEFQFLPMHPNLIEIMEVLSRLQYNKSDIEDAMIAFKHWCNTSIDRNGLNIMDIYDFHYVRDIWEKIRSNFAQNAHEENHFNNGYIVLCDLALTLISCLASESQCERYISRQKLALCMNTKNINKDLLDAILVYVFSYKSDRSR